MSGPIPSRQPSFTSPPPTPPTRRPSALSGAGGVSAEQRRARREQFRSFYGLQGGPKDQTVVEGEPQTGEGSKARKTGDPLDINSLGFDAASYYEDLIKKSSLAELMQAAASMSADINNLQSSRHSLVYNHHHQLFAAGDTISHLNSRTPQLLAIMTSLQDSFSSISQLADSVTMPSDPSLSQKGDDSDGNEGRIALETGLERVRLMFIAEEEPLEIRRIWDSLDKENIKDDGLRTKIEGLRIQIDNLPPSSEPDQPQNTPTIQIQTS